jgi:hypothetical protein
MDPGSLGDFRVLSIVNISSAAALGQWQIMESAYALRRGADGLRPDVGRRSRISAISSKARLTEAGSVTSIWTARQSWPFSRNAADSASRASIRRVQAMTVAPSGRHRLVGAGGLTRFFG